MNHMYSRRWMVAPLFLAVVMVAGSAFATKKVYGPMVEHRELEFEARGNYDFDDDADGLRSQKYAVGYGLFEKLFVEVYGEIEKEGEDEYEFESVELAARYQLFEQGERWVDAGLYGAYEIGLEGHVDKVEAKLLLQKQFAQVVNSANIIFERTVGDGSTNDLATGLAWSSRYRLSRNFEPGVEYHGGFGPVQDFAAFDEQSHLVGPVFYGKVGSFKYDVGYLVGISDGAPDGMLKWIIEYEFHL